MAQGHGGTGGLTGETGSLAERPVLLQGWAGAGPGVPMERGDSGLVSALS